MKCSRCGARVRPDAIDCPRCGAWIDDRPVGRDPAATQAPVNNKPLLIAMAAILVVLIIVTFLAFSGRLSRHDDDPALAAPTAQTAQPEETADAEAAETQPPAPTPSAAPSPTPTPTPTPTPAPTPAATAAPTTSPRVGSFLLPDSSSRYLTETDLADLTWEQLTLARNEIFARHGRLFADPQIAAYFEAQPWYIGAIPANAFSSDLLSAIERANIDLITRYEDANYGGSYY